MSEMKVIIKILCLIWVLFFPVVGFAQGQITRPTPPITRPTPRDPLTHNGKGSSKKQGTSNSHRRNNKVDKPMLVLEPAVEILDVRETHIFFGASETDIADSERGKVENVVKYLKADPETTVGVIGYADAGTDSNPRINMQRSQERAENVAKELVDAGIDPARITLSAKGDTNQSTDGHDMNRVIIVLNSSRASSPHSSYVDLGLPSGTLWKDANETDDYFTYEEAVNRFGDKLPTKEQLEELKDKCQWTWNGNGYKVTGPNGNSIVLPAAGCRSCIGIVDGVGSYGTYWSSTPSGSDKAWYLYFYSVSVDMNNGTRCFGHSVRLVHDSEQARGNAEQERQAEQARIKEEQERQAILRVKGFVDLGLPSGTLWKAKNEVKEYEYDSAVEQFGDNLPTREHWEELKNYCKWEWYGSGYKITGANGNSIVLPATDIGSHVRDGIGGFYWIMDERYLGVGNKIAPHFGFTGKKSEGIYLNGTSLKENNRSTVRLIQRIK